jgi:hypothetical protein
MPLSNWDYLRAGKTKEAFRRFTAEYRKEPAGSEAMELGAALLWTNNFRAAIDHFHDYQAQTRHRMDFSYYMSGAAEWCLGNVVGAVSEFRNGLKSQYADGAGGVQNPLLLFMAAALEPKSISIAEAVRILEKRAADPRIVNWPGQYVQLVLRLRNEGDIRSEIERDNNVDNELEFRRLEFYASLVDLSLGKSDRFAIAVRRFATLSWDEYAANADFFFSCLWTPEFHIARSLAENLDRTIE